MLVRYARGAPPMPLTTSQSRQLKDSIGEAAVAAARYAQDHFGGERIYGFCLYHGQFLYLGATAFTEVGLAQVEAAYRARGSGTSDLRWSPCDSPRHFFAESLFDAVNEHFSALERDDAVSLDERCASVELSALQALVRVRQEVFVTPDVVLTLMEGDQSGSQRYAYAERLNAPEALRRFHEELGPHGGWEHLEFYRSQVPAF
jgi:hypothetical protein